MEIVINCQFKNAREPHFYGNGDIFEPPKDIYINQLEIGDLVKL